MAAPLNLNLTDLIKFSRYKNQKELASIFNCSVGHIQHELYKYNIPYFKSKFNYDYFKTWSSNMAWILGFITADGSIQHNKPYLRIELQRQDEEILFFIKKELETTNKIYKYIHFDKRRNSNHESSVLCVHSQILIQDLAKLGIFPNKTGKHRINFSIPIQYQHDYVRGFFDGDGSVYLKKNRNCSTFSCKSVPFLEDLLKITNLGYIYLNNNPPRINMNHKESVKLYKYMYKNDNEICLTRKKEKFINVA